MYFYILFCHSLYNTSRYQVLVMSGARSIDRLKVKSRILMLQILRLVGWIRYRASAFLTNATVLNINYDYIFGRNVILCTNMEALYKS